MTISPQFSTIGVALAAAIVAYLAVGEPLLGRRMYADLERRRDQDPRALTRYFQISIGYWWGMAALLAVIVAVSPDLRLADLGLTVPEEPLWAAVLVVGIAAAGIWSWQNFRRLAKEGRNVPGLDTIVAMLPRTPRERRLAVAVAVSEGVWGELAYRGLLIAFAVGVLNLNLYVAAALSLVVYAAAGAYKGPRGVAITAVFGLPMTLLYVTSGSLLVPIVFHTVFMARDLLIVPSSAPSTRLGNAQG